MQLRKSELVPHWFYFFNYLFIYYVLLCWVFFAVYGLLSCGDRGPRCGTQASSPAVLLLLRSTGSGVCGLQELWLMGLAASCMWSLPRPGIEPTSLASAGKFFTAEPPTEVLPFYVQPFLKENFGVSKPPRRLEGGRKGTVYQTSLELFIWVLKWDWFALNPESRHS